MAECKVWVEEYRPHKVADCILPKRLKETFQGFVDQGYVPPLTLVGSPGTGKTSVAKAMLDELGVEYRFFAASGKDRGIETIKHDIENFASSVSFTGKHKYIILDEADGLTFDAQNGLRNAMEAYSTNCGFVLTANYENRIHEAIRSRGPVINFQIPSEETSDLCVQFLKRVETILAENNVSYDKATVAAVIRTYFPDWRRALGALQLAGSTGDIRSNVLHKQSVVPIRELVLLIKEKDYSKIRQWAADNINQDHQLIYREFYDEASNLFKKDYVPEFVMTLARYMTQSSQVFDQEINFVAFCTEVMVGASWNDNTYRHL